MAFAQCTVLTVLAMVEVAQELNARFAPLTAGLIICQFGLKPVFITWPVQAKIWKKNLLGDDDACGARLDKSPNKTHVA